MAALDLGVPVRGSGRLGLGAAVAAVFTWGFAAIFANLTTFDGLTLAGYRMWLSALFMVIVLVVTRRRLTWHDIRRSVPGGLFFAADVAMFFSALKLTSVIDATLIGALQPALVLLVAGSWFGEQISRAQVWWTVLAIVGVTAVVLASGGSGGRTVAGDLLAVGALFAWTGYWLASKHARAELGTIEYMTAIALIGALVITPFVLVLRYPLEPIVGHDWLWLGMLVVVSGAGAHGLMNWAHRFVAVSVSSVLVIGIPIVAAAAALIVLGQPLHPLELVGGVIALAAIVAIVRGGPQVAT